MNRLSQDLHRLPGPSSGSSTSAYRRGVLGRAMHGALDRVNVLGDDDGYGHSGCVNALSWALDGDLLLSGGDDRTVIMWKLDLNNSDSQYPYRRTATVHTGHTANIFNAQLLPFSSRMATVAGDGQVRVFDVERPLASSDFAHSAVFTARETCQRVFRCHSEPTKRITTEESPDLFLTVAEDGTVRQHDLRNPHNCRHNKCPSPLVQMPHELSTLALSPLSPHLFVVAGQSAYGYLFDRRQTGRLVTSEWGVPCREEHLTTCVRRFGRAGGKRVRGIYEHITGARMAKTNGHEVLLSYNNGNVYLYSIYDDIVEDKANGESSFVPPKKRRESTRENKTGGMNVNVDDILSDDMCLEGSSDDSGASESEGEPPQVSDLSDVDFEKMPTLVLPRMEYKGHCNVETVKDVNFIGTSDEFVASGSDDGNFFLWDKGSGKIHGIYEGDGYVVNVIEQHPRLPLIACSGIDTTVKLFAPTTKASLFSRMSTMKTVCEVNGRRSTQSTFEAAGLERLLWRYRMRLFGAESDSEDEKSESE